MNWHRLFGLLLSDFFTGTPFVVELEKDLSLKKQLLDVVILRKGRGKFTGQLPDGFAGLTKYNLITFKSHQESLDDWALKELTGHYVNLRKQVSPSMQTLLPEEEFRLYAVCSRYPSNLAGAVDWRRLQNGVFECRRGTDLIDVVVIHDLPRTENNALLHLLGAAPDQVGYGVTHYQQHSADTSSLLARLFEGYEREGLDMPYTMEDFRRDFAKDHLKDLTPKERVEGLSSEQLLQLLPIEERLKGLSPDERLQGLSPDERLQGLSPDERLQGLPPEEIEKFLERHKPGQTPRKRKKKS